MSSPQRIRRIAPPGRDGAIDHGRGLHADAQAPGLLDYRNAGECRLSRRSIVRTGIGFDSHRFAPGVPLILGGVNIPSENGLVGHSDADAVAHAVTDAIFGGAGEGDIGTLFPIQIRRTKIVIRSRCFRLPLSAWSRKGFSVANVDIVVMAEQPAIGPHRAAMRSTLAHVLHVAADAVTVKGKTNEGMGWIGRGEGIACIAIAGLAERGSKS